MPPSIPACNNCADDILVSIPSPDSEPSVAVAASSLTSLILLCSELPPLIFFTDMRLRILFNFFDTPNFLRSGVAMVGVLLTLRSGEEDAFFILIAIGCLLVLGVVLKGDGDRDVPRFCFIGEGDKDRRPPIFAATIAIII